MDHSLAPPAPGHAATAAKIDTSILRLVGWLGQYGLRRRAALLLVFGTMLLKVGLEVLKPWPMKVLVDHALGDRPATGAIATIVALLPGAGTREGLVTWSVLGTIVLFLLGWALGVATRYANIGFGQRMVYDLAGDLFGHLQRLSLRFHARKSVGDTIRRVTTDCECASVIVEHALLPLIAALVSLVAMFSVMWRLEPRLTLLSLLVVPYVVLVLRRYMQPMLERSYEQEEADGELYNVVEQTLAAIPIVQAFGREKDNDRRFERGARASVRASLRSASVGLQFGILTSFATTAGSAMVLWYGAQSVLEGRLTVGDILVFLSYLSGLYGPLESLMYVPSTTQGAAGSARRVLEILETTQEVGDLPDARAIAAVQGYVRFDDVTFGYDRERAILKGVTLEARPGDIVAIVGPTGAGKTTAVSLLPRFYDALEGRVLVDGHDVRTVRLRDLRAQISLVLQEPVLFPLTLADNIAYGRLAATRDEIEAAARAANAHDFIARLPQGYDTLVGERGATLSGGERQRISIARALLKNAPILILDEPTSAVDAATEASLIEALERLMRGRTTFVIAHRLSTIRHASQILVLDNGEVVERGTHHELLARAGLYARLYASQFGEGGGREGVADEG